MMKQKKQYINNYIRVFSLLVVLCCPPIAKAQIELSLPPIPKSDSIRTLEISYKNELPFAIDSLLKIHDETNQLESVFQFLQALETGKDTTMNIVHLGDSHIQAGHLSGRLMRLLHQQFGNAGRGWVAPFKLSKVNEPDDYFLYSTVKDWVAGRITQRQKKTPIGPGGIGIKSASSSINLDIVIAPLNGAGYTFNQAILYRGNRSLPMLPTGTMKDSVETARSIDNQAPRLVTDTFRLSKLTDMLQLHSTRRKPGTDELLPASHFENIYYGLNLTNGNPGILYHAVGVNGAMFVNYTDDDFLSRLALLKPDLFIISLGTNESFGSRFIESELRSQIHDFLLMVKKYMPNTALLLTTPPECYKRIRVNKQRTYVRNDNTSKAAAAILKQAKEEGIACWDLFTATGGKDSSKSWYKEGLLGRDRIHFTQVGYQKQADLLFLSLMNWYTSKKNDLEKQTTDE